MVKLTIRCHPNVPVATEELERWLELEVHELRRDAPRSTVRLSRLTQALPSADVGIGWLLELELAEDEPLLSRGHIADALRDMRLLGLEPTVLVPAEGSDSLAARDDIVAAAAPDHAGNSALARS